MKKEDCIFCKIANGDIPSKTLYEDEDFRVILDLGRQQRVMLLFYPRSMRITYMNCRMRQHRKYLSLRRSLR